MISNIQITKLGNGIRVVSASDKNVESVTVGLWVGVGGRYEPKRLSGISHFIEHMLFKGTADLSAGTIAREIEGCGGYFNGFTTQEMTCFYATVAYNHFAKVLRILCKMLSEPKFDIKEFQKERLVIIEELRMTQDQPDNVVSEQLDNLLWPDHQLGRPLIGTLKSLTNMSRQDIVRYKQQKYTAKNIIISVAGNVEHQKAAALAEQFMSNYPSPKKPAFHPFSQTKAQKPFLGKSKDIEQAYLTLGFKTFGREDEKRYILNLLSIILGGNMSSRLFKIVREKHGLAYSVHSSIKLYRETGALMISGGFDRTKYIAGVKLIMQELNRIKEKRIAEKELERAKEYEIGHLRIRLEDSSGQMQWLATNLLYYNKIIPLEDVINNYKKVTVEEIYDTANSVINSGGLSVSALVKSFTEKDKELITDHFKIIK
jgi:predicted Zn-dependent peptidase